ncbi:MAG: NAD(+)/NADH kinase, partial [Acidobacteria bacterium]|nr:NAD(+)/NADH kinase [Acidobacteriota bacterium]
ACREGADLILVCGGDGTVNEVVNGLAGTPTPLAVLPAGTANVMAVETGLPLDPVRAAALLPQLEPRRISLGRVTGETWAARYFLLLCGVGLDARIVYNLNLQWKSYLGKLAYWAAGLSLLGRRLEAFEVAIGEARHECTFALAARVRAYGGNLHIARRAHLLHPDLEVVLFPSRSTLRYLVYLAAVSTGTLHRLSDVTFIRTRRIELRADAGVPVEVDGEYAGRLPATVEMVPDALTLLLPPSYIRAPIATHG